jgi:hypothetical protein
MNAEFESLNGELQDMNAMLEEEIQDRQRAEDEAPQPVWRCARRTNGWNRPTISSNT